MRGGGGVVCVFYDLDYEEVFILFFVLFVGNLDGGI